MTFVRVVFLGPKGSGKSSLVSKLTENIFSLRYIPTHHVDFKQIKREGLKINIWDFSGDAILVEKYIKVADIIFVVFDLSSQKSFIDMTRIVNTLKGEKARVVIVGTKGDLINASYVEKPDFVSTWAEKGLNLDAFLPKEEKLVKVERKCCFPFCK
jgi:small GTP-binding protein